VSTRSRSYCGDRTAERVQISSTYEPRPASCNHFN
jgi:hypothetical protein